jgi:spoIIIJ-associated protein
MKEKAKTLKELADKLFSLMEIDANVSVAYSKDDKVFTVDVDASDATGLLIGKRGETLLSIQSILSMLFKEKVGSWERVVVNVGDYRQKEEEYLRNLATTTAQRAAETGTSQNLYNLKAWQRRVIHLVLADSKDVTTSSEGEGEERYLIISPKK